jgi:hypothetical protein
VSEERSHIELINVGLCSVIGSDTDLTTRTDLSLCPGGGDLIGLLSESLTQQESLAKFKEK